MGLDPGIDHMSAMQLIDGLKAKGATITGFKSHCGGLVAPESDTNHWHYKFTWNPRNVILAGQGDGGIHYLMNGDRVTLKYEDLFDSSTQLEVEGYGEFESYPNRDSLKYIQEYGLDGIATMYRGTLRVPPFCFGWDMLVQMGLTAEKEVATAELIQQVVTNMPMDDGRIALLESTGVLDALNALTDETVNPAKLLQSLLEQQWKMQPGDKDMIVMVHELEYEQQEAKKHLQSSLVYIGIDEEHTAMATTVGLPVAIVTKMILNGEVKRKGVLMPKYADIYNPILKELENYGVKFKEKEM
jgi:saccharopine dehydrogenase-like NADP-dependent oxidoreductase